MADWDANSPELQQNLQEVGRRVTADANAREPLSSESIRQWQALIMRGLVPGDGEPAGTFRGEAGLEDYDVAIGLHLGTSAGRVRGELTDFDDTLADQLERFDRTWAHGEWVRIHPFPNGNGRTSRLLVNSIALRYGLPAFMRVRPRPGDEYEWIANEAMEGNWQAAIPLFTRLYEDAL